MNRISVVPVMAAAYMGAVLGACEKSRPAPPGDSTGQRASAPTLVPAATPAEAASQGATTTAAARAVCDSMAAAWSGGKVTVIDTTVRPRGADSITAMPACRAMAQYDSSMLGRDTAGIKLFEHHWAELNGFPGGWPGGHVVGLRRGLVRCEASTDSDAGDDDPVPKPQTYATNIAICYDASAPAFRRDSIIPR